MAARPLQYNEDTPYKFRQVNLLKDEYLGRGAYGVVYRAKCDQLRCAAKYLHPTFFESYDPGEVSAVAFFRAECEMLRRLHHPNIVQYLGVHQEEGINTLILLMEEMEGSLHAYLSDHKNSPLPFHREVDLMFDITLALDYLHVNNIYHRDLSSKNVLLKGTTAKVSDFGVAKLRDPNAGYSSDSPVPGNIVYMPPEVLKLPPKFDKSLDEFSMGVVMIEIMGRKYPQPTDLHIQKADGHTLEIVPEVDRRKSDIECCNQLNPLLQIALSCISNDPKERPLSDQISRLLSLLQNTTEYRNSTTSCNTRTASSLSLPTSDHSSDRNSLFSEVVRVEIEDREGILKEMEDLRKRLQEKNGEMQAQKEMLKVREKQLEGNVAQLQAVENTLQGARETLYQKETTLQECYRKLNDKNQRISELEKGLSDSQSSVEAIRMQQSEMDSRVGNYISQIDVLQAHFSEQQETIDSLEKQLKQKTRDLDTKHRELQDAHSRLMQKEAELVTATMKNIRTINARLK